MNKSSCVILSAMLVLFGQVIGHAEPSEVKDETSTTNAYPARFPKQIKTNKASFIVHPPQIEAWEEYLKIDAWLVIEATPKDSDQSYFGTLRLQAETQADFDTREVVVSNFAIEKIHFLGVEKRLAKELEDQIRQALRKEPMIVSLDLLLASATRSQQQAKSVAVLRSPPVIHYSNSPAILVLFDGELVLHSIKRTSLKYAINTNWDFFPTYPLPRIICSIRTLGYKRLHWRGLGPPRMNCRKSCKNFQTIKTGKRYAKIFQENRRKNPSRRSLPVSNQLS